MLQGVALRWHVSMNATMTAPSLTFRLLLFFEVVGDLLRRRRLRIDLRLGEMGPRTCGTLLTSTFHKSRGNNTLLLDAFCPRPQSGSSRG